MLEEGIDPELNIFCRKEDALVEDASVGLL
jgi:hypothetical protein